MDDIKDTVLQSKPQRIQQRRDLAVIRPQYRSQSRHRGRKTCSWSMTIGIGAR
jgi:hypothetical protein